MKTPRKDDEAVSNESDDYNEKCEGKDYEFVCSP